MCVCVCVLHCCFLRLVVGTCLSFDECGIQRAQTGS